MADVSKETKVIKLLKEGKQRAALDALYDNFTQSELNELGQIGTRITAMTETVHTKKGKEANARRRSIGSDSTFIRAE